MREILFFYYLQLERTFLYTVHGNLPVELSVLHNHKCQRRGGEILEPVTAWFVISPINIRFAFIMFIRGFYLRLTYNSV